ncbi:MAG TPA: hypothetical protein VJ063_07055 [Verrucomicrobiae bacterium]|nr:hypothetical protein [Verrucomicrobiae bacterium]
MDETSNDPLTFVGDERLETVTLDNYVQREGTNSYFTSVLLGKLDAAYNIERSSDMVQWTPFTTVTNDNQ